MLLNLNKSYITSLNGLTADFIYSKLIKSKCSMIELY